MNPVSASTGGHTLSRLQGQWDDEAARRRFRQARCMHRTGHAAHLAAPSLPQRLAAWALGALLGAVLGLILIPAAATALALPSHQPNKENHHG